MTYEVRQALKRAAIARRAKKPRRAGHRAFSARRARSAK